MNLRHIPLVESDWLAANLGAPGLRIIDTRWRGDGSGAALYQAGHIPGAVHLDWHFDLNETRAGTPDLLLLPERFADVVGRAGIGDDRAVVLYAEADHSGAARLWWALRYYGYENAAVLNGGISKWTAEGRALTAIISPANPARFAPVVEPRWLATTADVAAALMDAKTTLVDTRPPEQFAGAAVWTPAGSRFAPPGQNWVLIDGKRMSCGHLPGALHLYSTTLMRESDWTFLTPRGIRRRAFAAGIPASGAIITYCGVGISAAQALFALYLAGYRELRLYDASWATWGTDPDRPVVRRPF